MYYLSDNYFPIQYEMKLIQIPLLIFAFLIVVNCAKDEAPSPKPETEEKPVSEVEEPQEPATEVYFTFNVGSSYESAPPTSEQVQNWIIIHDTEGNLIDYKSFENGDQLVFEKVPEDIPEQLNITIFNHHFRIKEYRHELETYPNIKKGSKWFLNTYRYTANEIDSSGIFNQTINNIPNPPLGGFPFYSLSTSKKSVFPDGISGSYVFGGINMKMENIPFYENREYLLLIEDRKNQVYHYTLIEPTQNITLPELDFADLTPVTLGANFSFPPTKFKSFLARGLTSDQSYNNGAFTLMDGPVSVYPESTSSNRSRVQIPIIETFDKFQTVVQMVMDDYKWFYRKQGDYPNNTFVPDKPIVEFVDKNINSFTINTDLDYQRKASSWFVRSDITDDATAVTIRKIHSTNTIYPTLGQIPEELTSLYPHIDLANITYSTTEFCLRSESYADFIFNTFETNSDFWNRDLELEILTLFKEE